MYHYSIQSLIRPFFNVIIAVRQNFLRQYNNFDYWGTGLTDGDNGRWAVTKNEADRHKFKTPTLRNVMLTTPYMHDGSITTIEDAIRIMHELQVGKEISDTDTKSIVSFLNNLTREYKRKLLQ